MIDKFYLSEPNLKLRMCDFIGDDDLACVIAQFEDVERVIFATDGVTRWVYFKPDVDIENAWLRLSEALEQHINARHEIYRQRVAHRPAVRWYAKHNGDLADVMFEHLAGAHAGEHEQYMRLPLRAAGVFVQLMNALEQHGVAYVQRNDETLSELVAQLAGELYDGAFA